MRDKMFVVMAGDLLVPMEGNHGRSSHSNVNAMAQVFPGPCGGFLRELVVSHGWCMSGSAAESAQGRGKWCQEQIRLNRRLSPASRPLCLGRVRADPACFLKCMHVTNPSVDTLLFAK